MAAEAPGRITVTRKQIMAAQLAVKASKTLGREPDPALIRIANAKAASR